MLLSLKEIKYFFRLKQNNLRGKLEAQRKSKRSEKYTRK